MTEESTAVDIEEINRWLAGYRPEVHDVARSGEAERLPAAEPDQRTPPDRAARP